MDIKRKIVQDSPAADEPTFLLRGADPLASRVMRFYADLMEQRGGDHHVCHELREFCKVMDIYPNAEVSITLEDIPQPPPPSSSETTPKKGASSYAPRKPPHPLASKRNK